MFLTTLQEFIGRLLYLETTEMSTLPESFPHKAPMAYDNVIMCFALQFPLSHLNFSSVQILPNRCNNSTQYPLISRCFEILTSWKVLFTSIFVSFSTLQNVTKLLCQLHRFGHPGGSSADDVQHPNQPWIIKRKIFALMFIRDSVMTLAADFPQECTTWNDPTIFICIYPSDQDTTSLASHPYSFCL